VDTPPVGKEKGGTKAAFPWLATRWPRSCDQKHQRRRKRLLHRPRRVPKPINVVPRSLDIGSPPFCCWIPD